MSIKILGLVSVLFLFSSCMMMAPNHLNGHSDNAANHPTMQTDLVCGQSFKTIQDASYDYLYNGNHVFLSDEIIRKK